MTRPNNSILDVALVAFLLIESFFVNDEIKNAGTQGPMIGKRAAYSSPTLTLYGTVVEFTKGTRTKNADGANTRKN